MPAMEALPVTSRSPWTWRLPGMIVATAIVPRSASIFCQFAFSAASWPSERWRLGVWSGNAVPLLKRHRGLRDLLVCTRQVFQGEDGAFELVRAGLGELQGALELRDAALLGRELGAVGLELGLNVYHVVFSFQAWRQASLSKLRTV